MAKKLADAVFDAAVDKLATSTRQTVTSAEPANFAGIAAVLLCSNTMTAGAGNGDYTKADGDVSGRKLQVVAQTGVSITNSGSATHINYDDGTTLLGSTTCTTQVLTAGGTVTIPTHKVEFADPT